MKDTIKALLTLNAPNGITIATLSATDLQQWATLTLTCLSVLSTGALLIRNWLRKPPSHETPRSEPIKIKTIKLV